MTPAGLVALVHALAGVWFIAGLIGRWITLGAAGRATDLRDMRLLLRVSSSFERMAMVGSIVVLVLGIAAALAVGRPFLGPIQGAPVDWLFVALVLFLSVVPLIPLVFVPRGKVLEAALERAGADEPVPDDVLIAFRDPVVYAAHAYELVAMVVVLALMLTKPF
jgi:hypothetical protein